VIHVLPLTIEGLVSVLLLLTILYCVRLNHQLKRLKADGSTMQTIIAELLAATESAERAIAGLKMTVRETEETLGEKLKEAERFSTDMRLNTAAGAAVLNRLTQIAGARLTGAEPPQQPKQPEAVLPGPQAIIAAAQALAERARARTRVVAA
jgi:hypothetical protein